MKRLIFSLILALSATAVPVLVSAAPTTEVISTSTTQVAKAECQAVHQSMVVNPQAGAIYKAWGREKSGNDCLLVQVVTEQVSHGVEAWDGCYNRQSYEYFTSGLWPYPKLAQGTMNYGLCWTSSQIEVSWTSCWVSTFLGYGGGENFCGGAPTSGGDWCGAEDDWYFFPYSMPWWHLNHGFQDIWYAPLYFAAEYRW